MKLFQASMSIRILKRYFELFPDDPLNVLLSLAYNQADWGKFMVHYRHMFNELIGDSGAWSKAHGTSDITIDEVIAYLQIHGHLFNRYFNFDTDFSEGGFENNIANQIKMEKAGLSPIPVVHNFFDKEIDSYVKSGKYEWIALGSSQASNFDDLRYAVDRIKSGNPDIKIHWFGGSKFEWLCKLAIAACDTTSWAAIGAYGYMNYWNDKLEGFNKAQKLYVGGRMREMKEKEYHFVSYPWRKDVEAYIAKHFGLTYADLCGYEDKFNLQLVNTRFYVELEKRVNAERQKRGIALE